MTSRANKDDSKIIITKDLILSRLRKDKMKLWLPPYYFNNNSRNETELKNLTRKYCKDFNISYSSSSSLDSNNNDNSKDISTTTAQTIWNVLVELQTHAVQKLLNKNILELKILSSVNDNDKNENPCLSKEALALATKSFSFTSMSTKWGDNTTITINKDEEKGGGESNDHDAKEKRDASSSASSSATFGGGKGGENNPNSVPVLILKIINVSPQLTIDKLAQDICCGFNVKSLRILYEGKHLYVSTDGTSFSNVNDTTNNNREGGNVVRKRFSTTTTTKIKRAGR